MSTARVQVSVVMAVHNGAEHLAGAFDSIRAQTFADYELIVIDDGSTDATSTLLGDAQRRDPRVKVVHQERRGLAASLNRGIEMSEGEFIARHDADDESGATRFERQMAFLHANASVAGVGTATVAIDGRGHDVQLLTHRVGAAAVADGLHTLKATPVHGSMMLRRSALEAVGCYRQAFEAAQDLDLWLRLTERFALDNLPDVLYRWRVHETGVFGARRTAQLMYAGVAMAFAHERGTTGHDSYAEFDRARGDLERFSAGYSHRRELERWWGELLFRGLNDPQAARPHLRAAIGAGDRSVRTLCLFGWSLLGLHWPGGPTLRASS